MITQLTNAHRVKQLRPCSEFASRSQSSTRSTALLALPTHPSQPRRTEHARNCPCNHCTVRALESGLSPAAGRIRNARAAGHGNAREVRPSHRIRCLLGTAGGGQGDQAGARRRRHRVPCTTRPACLRRAPTDTPKHANRTRQE